MPAWWSSSSLRIRWWSSWELWRGRHPNDTRSGVMIKFISRAEQSRPEQTRYRYMGWDEMK